MDSELRNPAWKHSGLKILICRLSPFKDVSRSTPHVFLYREIRDAFPAAFIDFSFFPSAKERDSLKKHERPFLFGRASGKAGLEFDLILVSNSFALELVNLPVILLKSNIPLAARDRSESSPPLPIIILGGSNAMAAQATCALDGNAMVDGIFFGEGEGVIAPLVNALAPTPEKERNERLLDASGIEGFWIPGSSKATAKSISRDWAFPKTPPPILDSEDAATLRLEISRGCPSFCTFCFEGRERKPYREHSVRDILSEAIRLKRKTGASTAELTSFNFNAHSDIVKLILGLNAIFDRVNMMSQRTDILASVGGLIDFELASGKKSFTLGIEGISGRIRAYFRKELSEETAKTAIESLLARKAREIKLFYIFSGLENDGDFREFEAFASWLRERKAALFPGARIVFSFGFLVIMPFTPLRYSAPILDETSWGRAVEGSKATLTRSGFEFRMPDRFDEYLMTQLLVSLPASSGNALLLESAKNGIFYDASLSKPARTFLECWMAAHEAEVSTIAGEKDPGHVFPFHEALGDPEAAALLDGYRDAKIGKETVSCFEGICSGCGACADAEREAITKHRITPPGISDTERLVEAIRKKRAVKPVFASFILPESLRNCGAEAVSAWLTRHFLSLRPESAQDILSIEDAPFGPGGNCSRLPSRAGLTVISIKTLDPGRFPIHFPGIEILEPKAHGMFEHLKGEITGATDDLRVAAKAWDGFLSGRSIQNTKVGTETGYRYEIASKAKRKKEILCADFLYGDAGFKISFEAGNSIDLSAFFSENSPMFPGLSLSVTSLDSRSLLS